MESKSYKEMEIITLVDLSMGFLAKVSIELKCHPNTTIAELMASWKKSMGLKSDSNFSLMNQGVILTHLYGLIVYPKEKFNIPDISLKNVDKSEWGEYKFTSFPSKIGDKDKKRFCADAVNSENDMTLEFLIRKIRNAISHASVNISESLDFEFVDKDGTRILFPMSEIQKFTQKIRSLIVSNSI